MAAITGISSATETYQTSQQSTGKSTAATTATAQTSSADTDDTVKLSAKAQAKLLHTQGQSIQSIASSLGITVKDVDGYLGISTQQALQQALAAAQQSTSAKA
jgi:hypothetical protein